MSMNAIIGLVVAVVVIGGGAWYFSSHQSGTMGTPGMEASQGGVTQPENGTLAFKDLLLMGGSRECTVTVNTPQAPSSGTLYISGQNVRSDIVAKASGMTITAHMIKNGDYIYSWTDMINQGVKVNVAAEAQGSTSTSSHSSYDPNVQVSYDCKAWIADASKFTVPSNITFTDYTSAQAH